MSDLLKRLIGKVPPDFIPRKPSTYSYPLTVLDSHEKMHPIMEKPKSASRLKYPRIKSAPVFVFMTPEEKAKLVKAAVAETGGNISEYIRRVLYAKLRKA